MNNRVLYSLHILFVGCGNSNICEDMAKEHKGSIEGIDISNTCIRNMRSIHRESIKKGISFTYVHCILWREENRSNVSYRVMDALHMHYPYDWIEMNDRNRKESFQCVFDKGTLDAINCGSFKNVVQLIREMEYDWLIVIDFVAVSVVKDISLLSVKCPMMIEFKSFYQMYWWMMMLVKYIDYFRIELDIVYLWCECISCWYWEQWI